MIKQISPFMSRMIPIPPYFRTIGMHKWDIARSKLYSTGANIVHVATFKQFPFRSDLCSGHVQPAGVIVHFLLKEQQCMAMLSTVAEYDRYIHLIRHDSHAPQMLRNFILPALFGTCPLITVHVSIIKVH